MPAAKSDSYLGEVVEIRLPAGKLGLTFAGRKVPAPLDSRKDALVALDPS